MQYNTINSLQEKKEQYKHAQLRRNNQKHTKWTYNFDLVAFSKSREINIWQTSFKCIKGVEMYIVW